MVVAKFWRVRPVRSAVHRFLVLASAVGLTDDSTTEFSQVACVEREFLVEGGDGVFPFEEVPHNKVVDNPEPVEYQYYDHPEAAAVVSLVCIVVNPDEKNERCEK